MDNVSFIPLQLKCLPSTFLLPVHTNIYTKKTSLPVFHLHWLIFITLNIFSSFALLGWWNKLPIHRAVCNSIYECQYCPGFDSTFVALQHVVSKSCFLFMHMLKTKTFNLVSKKYNWFMKFMWTGMPPFNEKMITNLVSSGGFKIFV